MIRRFLDRALAGVAIVIMRGFFRDIEVQGRDRVPRRRPVLVVANHFNGFVDPVMLTYVFGRLPRFLAKATLQRVTLARPLLALAGIVPVNRPQDADVVLGNRSTFEECHQFLRRNRGLVAIFPEGTTHDKPSLERIHTGAARIALGARAAGAKGLLIIPVGLIFDDKLALRSRVLARVGEPIDLDAAIARFVGPGEPQGESNHEAVRRLTAEIAERLRGVSQNYESYREAQTLGFAAEVVLRSHMKHPRRVVPLTDREALAQRLARTSVEDRRRVESTLGEYALDLHLLRLREDQLAPGYSMRILHSQFLWSTVKVLVLLPFAALGVVVNLLPFLIVRAVSRAAWAPVTKGTVRFLVALVVFPATWILVTLLDPWEGFGPGVAVFFSSALFGFAAVYAAERIIAALSAWRNWRVLQDRRALLEGVRSHRAELVAAVETALGEAVTTPVPTA